MSWCIAQHQLVFSTKWVSTFHDMSQYISRHELMYTTAWVDEYNDISCISRHELSYDDMNLPFYFCPPCNSIWQKTQKLCRKNWRMDFLETLLATANGQYSWVCFETQQDCCMILFMLRYIGSFIYYVGKIFLKMNISYPLTRIHSCAYQGVSDGSFSENFANVIHEWSAYSIIP